MNMKKDDQDILTSAKDAFELAETEEADNRERGLNDIRFSRGGEQWPEAIRKQREDEGRPCLTINKLPAFIRQVVNDARQNKPSIKVHPVDSGADRETADVINGLIRNIERESKADLAYDTAIESAVSGGFGYIRVGADYAFDDVFDMDISINRVANPFSIYGDPNSTSADGSDWNSCFVVERLTKEDFEEQYGDKSQVDWDDTAWSQSTDSWRNDEGVMVAEWWVRKNEPENIHKLSNGMVVSDSQMEEDQDLIDAIAMGMVQVASTRKVMRKKVTQYILTGQEVLETNQWPGRYIPIVPVYGDEFFIEGKRQLRSLIHNAIDAQSMHNFWRTNSTELVALAPRVPYIGPKGAFDDDPNGWATANTVSHPYLTYKGSVPPQRQPLDSGTAAGALQEALMAADDMKSIIGIYDAGLGAKSNETSGRAILARQREGDVSTFHFIDNLSRAIRQLGLIVLDLIPHYYNTERVIRVLGEDDTEKEATINGAYPKMDENGQPETDERGQAIIAMHDLTSGKYDLTVTAGPSFTSRREEAAFQMTEALRSFPMAAPVIMPMIAKNSDWPGADELAEKLEALAPPDQDDIPPQLMQQMQMLQQQLAQVTQENQLLKNDQAIKAAEAQTKQYDAETKRMKVEDETDLKLLDKLTPAPTSQGVQQL